jgi:hypothetical protein
VAILRNNPKGLEIIGNQDKQISPYRKIWIKAGNYLVVGVISAGTARRLSANWVSPYEDAAIGSGGTLQKTSAAVQEYAGLTMVTELNSQQSWEGSPPHDFPITMRLYALVDPITEVREPLIVLESVASPDLNEFLPVSGESSDGSLTGSPPSIVSINIGRNAIYSECVIESIDIPLDGPTDSNGDFTNIEITLNVQSKSVIDRPKIRATYG